MRLLLERFSRSRLILALVSIAYAILMLSLCPAARLYGLSPYHGLQADALLHGRLYLADSIEQLRPGLAWHDGKVQQVWGLGVGLWLLPLQAIWKLFGGQIFPTRIGLGMAFALLAFYAGSTGLRIAGSGQRTLGVGLWWLIILCPPLWTLARYSQLVFEETVLYGVLLSLGILVALFRVAYFDSRADLRLGCAFSAFAGLVRPTCAVYGLSAMAVCSIIWFARRRAIREIVFANLGFIAGLGLVATTNLVRFGSPMEFGHRMTTATENMVYMTRLGNPYAQTAVPAAVKEMFGLLFLNGNARDAGAFSDNLFPGQGNTTRWRKLYMTTFDISYALMCGITIIGTGMRMIVLRPKSRTETLFWEDPLEATITGLWLWSVISTTTLGLFYLYAPAVASRYLLDFLPGIVGLLILNWLFISLHRFKLSLLLLAGWLLYELAAGQVVTEPAAGNVRPESTLSRTKGKPIAQFGGSYTTLSHPIESGIAFNGEGWEAESGFADDIVVLAVDRPQMVELRVSDRRVINGETARKDDYRAVMEGRNLQVQEIVREGEEQKVRFRVPEDLQAKQELVFICFSSGYDVEDRGSERFLFSVRWR